MNEKQNLKIQEYELPIMIQAEKEEGFVATCPIWQDCYAQGDTVEDAINEISYVASSLIELYKEENMKIPLKIKKTSERKKAGFTLNFPLIVSAS